MRILQVSSYFYPYIGGQERYVRNLARGLLDRGHTVEVLTSNFPKSKKNETIDGMEVRRFDFVCKPLNNPISPMLLFHVTRHCREFDLLHCHNERAAVSLYCALTKSWSNLPLILTCHGHARFDQLARFSYLIERAYSTTLGARILRKADKVVAISDSDKEYVSSLGVPLEKIRVIPNGVDLTQYNFQGSDLPKGLMIEGKQVILFVGPLIKRKGPQVLVQAIPLIVEENPDAFFVFVGKGNFKEEVEKLSRKLGVERYTHFTGYIPENQLHYLYQQSEVFALPSIGEALAYTILDAFVFSKPVVSTLIPCIKDYLSDSALLIQPEDFKALAEAVLCLLNDKKMAKELGKKGRRLVETRFTWNAVVNQVEGIYKEILNIT